MKKFTRHILILILLFPALSLELIAQTATIEGHIKQGSEGIPIAGITILIQGVTTSSTTNLEGYYYFGTAANLNEGDLITITVSSVGYSGAQRTLMLASGINNVDFWFDAVSDADGNSYSAIEIGSQLWMGENLRTTHYNGGTAIPNVTDVTTWSGLITPAYSWYNNDNDNMPLGALYNWYAVDVTSNGGNNLCPAGWHVPSDAEWTTLTATLGGEAIAGGKMREAGTAHWADPNTGATNLSGFNALPAGYREYTGSFASINYNSFFWSSTEYDPTFAWFRFLTNYDSRLYRSADVRTKVSGFSVRCIKNISLPVISTAPVTDITPVSATSGGNISSDGGSPVTYRGVCWNGVPNPTINNRLTNDGQGIGSFTSQITGLSPDSTYYIRAYATNSTAITYGEEWSFTTCSEVSVNISGTTTVCQGSASPNITFTGTSGTPPFTITYGISGTHDLFVVHTSETSFDVDVPVPTSTKGTFIYTIYFASDANGTSCSQPQSGSATVTVNPLPELSADVTQISCSGGYITLGSIDLAVTGTGVYTYDWTVDPGEYSFSGEDPESLEPGMYQVTVIDGNSCSNTLSAEVLDPLIVTNIEDAGMGSLRNAITYANLNEGDDQIDFDIQTAGVKSIKPESPLPDISDPVIIDGYSQPGAEEATETTPAIILVELDGTSAGEGANGIVISTSNCEIKGLVINRFSNAGIHIGGEGISGNKIKGNYIGTNAAGTSAIGNAGNGIVIDNGASANIIGGTEQGEGNLISGNTGFAININGEQTKNNQAINNLIGTNAKNTGLVGNGDDGVNITESSGNTISGNVLCGAGIGGVGNNGIEILGSSATGNIISDNYIGTNSNGASDLGNGFNGIQIKRNAHNNTIGPNNVISGNYGNGILIESDSDWPGSTSADKNVVTGNLIGTTPSGTGKLGNGGCGILIKDKASENVIGPDNTISGNNLNGIQIYGNNSDGNVIIGNLIGTDAEGVISVPNKTGIQIDGVHGIIVGGLNESDRNIISGNETGIRVEGVNASDNIITGNYIGTNITGSSGLPNFNGISIENQAYHNIIGGIAPGSGNLIAYNTVGIYLGSDSTFVKGNEIHGSIQEGILVRGSNNNIGGSDNGSRNYFHDNNVGISIWFEADYNLIEDNYLGTDRKGETDQTTGENGVALSGSYNLVKNNLISGYNNGHGIYIARWDKIEPIPEGNRLEGNIIGMDASGTKAIPNQHGIAINTAIGTIVSKNLIAGNQYDGIHISSQFFAEGDDYQYSVGNLISQNSIYYNGQLGIDLNSDFVSENDSIYNEGSGKWDYDYDLGANNLQNFPVIEEYKLDLGAKKVTVGGYLESTANNEYTLEFFASRVGENTGYGEGEHYLGSLEVTTDADGKGTFDETFAINSSWGDVITATATDALGNTSEFSASVGGMQSQIIPEDMWPFYYRTNTDGILRITDGSDTTAVSNSFKTWNDIATATIDFRNGGPTNSKYASANDGINLITFVDDQFPFSPGILAIAAKTLKVVPGEVDAHIIDADIVVNPEFAGNYVGVGYDNPNEGYFDAQSIITHEIGHVLGLIHSGVYNSTMFYKLDAGTKVRSLEQDDISWTSYRYPTTSYDASFGSISGNITYAYGGEPVAGALVLAINTAGNDTIHAYSDASGHYIVPGLPAGNYNIYIEPLDGSTDVHNLKPGNVSLYLYSNTVYTDYPGEFYSWDEGDDEKGTPEHPAADDPKLVAVTSSHNSVADLITNKDLTKPKVLSVYPPKDIADISITTDIIVTFSEPVDDQTLTSETCYLEKDGEKHGVEYVVIGNNTDKILLSLDSALNFSSDYLIHITEGVMDLKGNTLESFYLGKFTTKDKDLVTPEITGTYPVDNAENVFVTDKVSVFFTKSMDMTSVENNFSLEFAEGDPAVTKEVEGSIKWDNSNQSLTFIPLKSLKEGTQYTINVLSDAADLSENTLGTDQSFGFTTVDQAAPVIVYSGPYDTEDDVTTNTPVVVDFSEPIDPGTITSSTFSLSHNGSLISGKFEFLNDNSRVVFRPDAPLEFSTGDIINEYTIKLTTGISDVSDPALKMETGMNTTFTTADKPVVPHIYYNEPPAGVVGSVVNISGTGFDPTPSNNIVQFNGTTAAVTSSTLSSLTTKVPMGALPGMVTLSLKNGITADNSMYFYVIPQSDNPCESIIANSSVGTRSTKSVAVEPNAAYAYVTNPLDNIVTVVDLKDNSVLPITIPVGKTPMMIDINPQGTMAFVTNFNSHDVSVIDLLKNEVINTIKVGIQPYGIAVTPDGKGVYVANSFSEDISLIDMDPNSGGCDHVIANVQTGTKTKNLAISPDASIVLVTGDFGLKIIDANPENATYNSVIANVSSGTKTRNVAITPDAGLAIVSTEDGNLLVINLHPENGDYSDAVIANISTGTKISNIRISPDAMFVYVTATDLDEILEYKLNQTGTVSSGGSSFGGLTLVKQTTSIHVIAPEGLFLDPKADNLYVIDGYFGSREVTTISLCCGPVTPEKALGDLIMAIQNMIHSGAIMESHGDLLINKLNDALYDLQNKKTKSVINDLRAFINQVNTLMDDGKMDYKLGLPLIDAASTLMDQLERMKSAKSLSINEIREQEEIETIPFSGIGVIYPNPSNTTFTINFDVATGNEESERVMISVYDVSGHIINTLLDNNMQPGHYTIVWNAKYDDGLPAERGTYFIHFHTGHSEMVNKVILVR